MALAGRIDGAYSCVSVLNYQLKKMNKAGALVFDPDLPHTKSSYLLSSVKHPVIIARFSEWLLQHQEEIGMLQLKYNVGIH